MNIFDFFKSREERAKEYNNVVPFPEPIKLVPVAEPESEEHYRVGFTTDDRTTLTLLSNGSSMTLTMDRNATEHLIKMLRSTYEDEE